MKLPGFMHQTADRWRLGSRLFFWNARLAAARPGSWIRSNGFSVKLHTGDKHAVSVLYRDCFVRGIYHFTARRPDPLIIDCGSNNGLTILFFKHLYPAARVIGFEPDPRIFPYLKETMERNGVSGVRLIQAALSSKPGELLFYSDGTCGSCLDGHVPSDIADNTWVKHRVPCHRLRDYLTEPVDFLKMNIESAEWEVLADSEDRLRHVNEMVIEYHHLPGIPRTLHDILELLHRAGFEYLINDFDAVTNPLSVPPFRLTGRSRYWLLIYARRRDAMVGEQP